MDKQGSTNNPSHLATVELEKERLENSSVLDTRVDACLTTGKVSVLSQKTLVHEDACNRILTNLAAKPVIDWTVTAYESMNNFGLIGLRSRNVLALHNDLLYIADRCSDNILVLDACNMKYIFTAKMDKRDELIVDGLVGVKEAMFVSFLGTASDSHRYLYSYDIHSNSWKLVSIVQTSVCKSQMTAVGDVIVFVGGQDRNSSVPCHSANVTMFDIRKQEWAQLDCMPTARQAPSCAVYNGEVYVAGGKTGYSYPWGRCNACEVLSLETGKWRSAPPTTMVGCAIAVAETGTIVATGGIQKSVTAREPESYLEMLDHRSGKWRELSNLPSEGRMAFHECCSTFNLGINIFCSGGMTLESKLSRVVPVYNTLRFSWDSRLM
ncbi:uncharacterized protein LOC134194965 [Corticium candelabrum]|uniref:uncharacterized protein LOC134194965 n=1 Tax=Corticium candelabrum TaxID=121492 RepID=UPI002E25BB36|nr:uncharacterized protein LOC134194965 [Corticium candelabrum]